MLHSFKKNQVMHSAEYSNDESTLSNLNAQFIKNFINGDVRAHEKIIHNDFVCIENSGAIVNRDDYMKAWEHDYEEGNFCSFSYTDEHIRIFDNVALVRSKSGYTKMEDGKLIDGNSIYTDTYLKENGEWKCVQVQITPLQIT